MDTLVTQIAEAFKAAYGLKITDGADVLLVERNMLEYLMLLGRGVMAEVFQEMDGGYEGPVIEVDEREYRFVGYRRTSLHGLFGMVEYTRAYYYSSQKGGGGYFPLDKKLGIEKRHTPGCQYFLSSFTGREAYEKSLEQFHEIFRPDGTQLISQRKALDMDAELGERLEQVRQEEIRQVFEQKRDVTKEAPIEGRMAISVDATKVREWGEAELKPDGTKSWPTIWRDAKIGAVSSIGWDQKRQEAFCSASSYVSSIEHADLFFQRLTVEMNRRTANPKKLQVVFVADGANWIWDRFAEMAPEGSTFILDFYHACEHLSDLCKQLYGEQTPEYWRYFRRWKAALFDGKVTRFLQELHHIRDGCQPGALWDFLDGEIKYFTDNQGRMKYDVYRAARLPIGSGTIESACKNVIAARMKQGGMTWSEAGANGMLQIRSSIASGRHLQDFIAALDLVA
jgi:hypothetical protein